MTPNDKEEQEQKGFLPNRISEMALSSVRGTNFSSASWNRRGGLVLWCLAVGFYLLLSVVTSLCSNLSCVMSWSRKGPWGIVYLQVVFNVFPFLSKYTGSFFPLFCLILKINKLHWQWRMALDVLESNSSIIFWVSSFASWRRAIFIPEVQLNYLWPQNNFRLCLIYQLLYLSISFASILHLPCLLMLPWNTDMLEIGMH